MSKSEKFKKENNYQGLVIRPVCDNCKFHSIKYNPLMSNSPDMYYTLGEFWADWEGLCDKYQPE